jgi:hypothetical protein
MSLTEEPAGVASRGDELRFFFGVPRREEKKAVAPRATERSMVRAEDGAGEGVPLCCGCGVFTLRLLFGEAMVVTGGAQSRR